MLTWCAYCQQYQGERSPFDDLAITHGICEACAGKFEEMTDAAVEHASVLRDIQQRLWDAGRRGDLQAAEQIVDDASKLDVRALDLMLGIIAPMLYKIGEEWRRAAITVADEHRFTAFCESVFDLVAAKLPTAGMLSTTHPRHADALLMNCSGNHHTLAIHILELWLLNNGVSTHLLHPTPPVDELVALIDATRPRILFLSMALAEHRAATVTVAERIAALPAEIRPRVIVGGYAIKLGFIEPIPHTEFKTDIHELRLTPA